MKYLVKKNIILSTENWKERNTTYKTEYDEEGNEKIIEITQSIEDFAKENGFTIVDEKPETLTSKELKVKYENELIEIKNWFLDNDYKVNKVFIGEWKETDARWTDYKKERTTKRARQDEIKALLGV